MSGVGEGGGTVAPVWRTDDNNLNIQLAKWDHSYISIARPLTVGNFNPTSLYLVGMGSNFGFLKDGSQL